MKVATAIFVVRDTDGVHGFLRHRYSKRGSREGIERERREILR